MSGKYACVVFGFVNAFGNQAGFVAPKIMGYILQGKNQGDPQSWTMVFAIPGIILTITLSRGLWVISF